MATTILLPDGKVETVFDMADLLRLVEDRMGWEARELLEENSSESSLMTVYDKLTPKNIAECCNKGDRLAIETYRRTGHTLG